MISAQFTYVFWVKEAKRMALFSTLFAIFCGISIIYYIWAGSPDAAVRYFNDFLFAL